MACSCLPLSWIYDTYQVFYRIESVVRMWDKCGYAEEDYNDSGNVILNVVAQALEVRCILIPSTGHNKTI